MDRKAIEEKINGFLAGEFEIDSSKLRADALLRKGLGIDSLDIVDIIVMIDNVFGVKVRTEELAALMTLSDLYDFIEKKTA